jgi:omega-amidase
MSGEHEVYAPGNRLLTVDVKGWKVRPFICYDLRFPVWSRNIGCAYDLALYVANWPGKRATHWKLLLPARAVENQAYVVGVNRVGTDGNGASYSGDSAVIDPLGTVLFQQTDAPCVHTATLSCSRVKEYRENFAAWRDADGELVSLPCPPL